MGGKTSSLLKVLALILLKILFPKPTAQPRLYDELGQWRYYEADEKKFRYWLAWRRDRPRVY